MADDSTAKFVAEAIREYLHHDAAAHEAGRRRCGGPPQPEQSARDPVEALAELLEDPVASAVRLAVREAGWEFHRRGGPRAMLELLRMVEDLVPEERGRAAATVDGWWEGIGAWAA